MLDLAIPWWEFVLRTVVVYAVVFALLRLGGKRELGQLTPFDLVVILVIANAVQNAMVGPDTSLAGGLIAATTLTLTNLILARFGERIPILRGHLQSKVALLLTDGKLIQRCLDSEGVTREEIEMAAREHGIEDLADLSAAYLEPNGSISVIAKRGDSIKNVPRHSRKGRIQG